MKKLLLMLCLLNIIFMIGCGSTPDETIVEAAEHFEKGLSGQGRMIEQDRDNEPEY